MSNTNLKVLLLSDALSFHTERFYKELKSQGCDVLLVSLEKGIPEALLLRKIGIMKQLHYRLAVKQIKSLIKTFQPDIISAHFASGYGHIAALAKRNSRIPLALNLWGSDVLIVPKKSVLHKYKTRYALKNSQHVFADSEYLIDAAKKIFPFENSSVIPWGVENEIFDLYKDTDISNPIKIIVPRLQEHVYNNLFIVESLKDLIIENKIELTFPAFGSLYKSFKESTNKIVGDKIKFYEKKERNEYLKFASSFDVYLSASLSDSSPVSLIEAMALGLIPVVMQIDGVREWVSPENGFMFEHSKESLLKAFENLLISSKDLYQIREGNKNKVKESAIFKKNIADQLSIFKSLVESSR